MKKKKFKRFEDMWSESFSLRNFKSEFGVKKTAEVKRLLLTMNIQRILVLSILVVLFQAAYILLYISSKSHGMGDYIRNLRLATSITIFFFSTISIIISVFMLSVGEKRKKLRKAFVRAYYFLLSTGMAAAVYVDLTADKSSNTLFYIALVMAIVPVFSLGEIFFFALYNSAAIGAVFMLTDAGLVYYNIQVLLIYAAGWLGAFFTRASTVSGLYDRLSMSELNDKLERLSKKDPLTGLPNRRALDDFVAESIHKWRENGTRVLVCMMDIDNFKNYNDTFSHLDGDDCLNAVCGAIKGAYSGIEGLKGFLARIGGEEFMMLLCGSGIPEDIDEITGKVCANVEAMRLQSGSGSRHDYVTISMGCSLFEPDIDDPMEGHFRIADYELYNAKNKGKNRVSYKGEIIYSGEKEPAISG